MKDVLIIGGGPAGLSAAIYAARAGLDFAIIEQMAAGGQAATTQHIENYPGFAQGIGGVELAMAMQTQAENLGAPFLYEQVQKMELLGAEKKIITEGQTLIARSVVLAMGARPRPLGLQGEEELRGKGISYCATCDGFFYKNKEAAVIGGGDTALEDALYLAKFCKQVTLIHRRNEFRAAGRLQEKVRKLENVKLLTPYRPVAFEQEDRPELCNTSTNCPWPLLSGSRRFPFPVPVAMNFRGGHTLTRVSSSFAQSAAKSSAPILQNRNACDPLQKGNAHQTVGKRPCGRFVFLCLVFRIGL